MPRILSDAEMAQLEASQPKRALSDEEMTALEAQHVAQPAAAPQEVYGPTQTPGQRAYHEQMAMLTPENVGAAGRNALSAMSGGLSKALPEMGKSLVARAARAVTPAVESGLVGAAQAPDDRLRGFLTGTAIKGGMDIAGSALGKLGDVAMQVGVGRKKYTPGVGTELANEGLWGTRGMMTKQAQRGLTRRGEEIRDLASQIEGAPIDARTIGQDIATREMGRLTGGGVNQVAQPDLAKAEAIRAFGEDVASRGSQTGPQALGSRIAAGGRAYQGKEDAVKSLIGQMSKQEQAAYSEALKKANPALAPADAAYGALKRAQKALGEEASLPRSLMGIASLPAVMVPGASVLPSTVGQVATKAQPVLEDWLAPLMRQGIVNQRK